MKFSEKYPNMRPIVDEAPNGIIRAHEKQPCWNCGELTEYVDINYEAPLCSEECQNQKDLEYIDACLKVMDENGRMAEW